MSMRRLLTALALISVPALASAQAAPVAPRPKPAQLPLDSMERARMFTTWFYNNQLDSIIAKADSGGRADPRAREALQRNVAMLAERAGTETEVIEEKFITRNGVRQYWRTAKFNALGEPVLIRFVMNSKGEYAGIGLSPLSSAPAIDP